MLTERLPHYLLLMRFDKPIGIFLLCWPTLWGLLLATNAHPSPKILTIFMLGVILMRAAGCVVNDLADRHFDKQVARTKNRPLAMNRIGVLQAIFLALFLLSIAFVLVLFCNPFTIQLAFIGAFLAVLYPFLKRVTHLPQLGLGLAFSWGIPMAFAAETNHIPGNAWLLYLAALLWPIIYDTLYAMVDKEDDMKINVKSTAILFSGYEAYFIGSLQILFLFIMGWVGYQFQLRFVYYLSLSLVAMLFIHQQHLLATAKREAYFTAFLNNNWVGLFIFLGILIGCLT